MGGYTHPHPESIYYHTAKDALDKVKELEKDRVKDPFYKKQLVVTTIVFSALCLETFINQAFWKHSETRKVIEENDNFPLITKWLMLPLLLGASETFDKGAQPFQDFKQLIGLRNNRVVHFKPGKEHRSSSGKPSRDEYLMKVLENVELSEQHFLCVEAMIRKLSELTGNKTGVPEFITEGRKTSSKIVSTF